MDACVCTLVYRRIRTTGCRDGARAENGRREGLDCNGIEERVVVATGIEMGVKYG